MKKGEVINGYKLLADFTTAGGGLSKWTFAQKGEVEFFFKEFLSPTYPTSDSPGSEATKERKRLKCKEFESRQRKLAKAIADACGPGGNLIHARDFFRSHTKYYKVTEKVDVASINVRGIAAMSLEDRLLIMKTVAHSLSILHRNGIVHGDLKPDNILTKKTGAGKYVSKLIDFDNSFFSENPPEAVEEIVGDFVFYSPEMARYVQEDENTGPTDLTKSLDIFALGLIYSLYLTGDMPRFDQKKYKYACDAANNGVRLSISSAPDLPLALTHLLDTMLALDYHERPTIDQVFNGLKAVERPVPTATPVPTFVAAAAPPTSGLKGKLWSKTVPSSSASGEGIAPPTEGKSKLTGKLIRKTPER